MNRSWTLSLLLISAGLLPATGSCDVISSKSPTTYPAPNTKTAAAEASELMALKAPTPQALEVINAEAREATAVEQTPNDATPSLLQKTLELARAKKYDKAFALLN